MHLAKRLLQLLMMALCCLAAACHEERQASRGQLCTQGGATLSATTNECLCPATKTWTGSRCDALVPVAAESTPALVPEPKPAPPPPPSLEVAAGLPTSQVESLRAACAKAHADWLPAAQFCQCPAPQVLVGQRCLLLHGAVTQAVCGRAVKPGRWRKGECECQGTDTFVPQRGGCVPPARGQPEVQRLSCESSLDLGHWDLSRKRCDCPRGRLWVDELCEVQTRLSSAIICESDFNRGTWDWGKKRCNCAAGQLWINQTCLDPHSLSQRNVCESEWNGGSWNASTGMCRCPRGGSWDRDALLCSRSG